MIALSIAAAGIIAIAAALLVRPTPELRTVPKLGAADQRGITLQTLIVTAVLVLMAVAAGVVIVAITNAQSDNLNEANTDTAARCEPWEIFDPTLAAAGRGGGNGGVNSSAIGCLRVCYISHIDKAADEAIVATDDIVPPTTTGTDTLLKLVMSRTNIATDNEVADTPAILQVSGRNETREKPDEDGDQATGVEIDDLDVDSDGTGDQAAVGYDDGNMIIKVASNQQYCHIWNYTTDSELVRSSRQ